jgi:hypothetical protein
MNSASFRHPRPWANLIPKFFVVLVAALLGSSFPVFAQGCTVYGTITDRNGRPLLNILVAIGQNRRYTDVSGHYRIGGVHPGRQHMICRRGSAILWQGDIDVVGAEVALDRRLS